MTNSNALDHLRPGTIAQLIAELIADHTEEMAPGDFDFRTEAAKTAYTELLDAGIRNCGETEFFNLLEVAVDTELGEQE